MIPIVVALLVIVIRFLHVKEDEEPKERAYSALVKNGINKNEKVEIEGKKKNNKNNNNSSKSNNHSVQFTKC